MKWITRERPKIDRIACPWLIKRFVDPKAEIIYVPFDKVLKQAEELEAIPFDLPGVEYSHYEDQCTFDYFLKNITSKTLPWIEWLQSFAELTPTALIPLLRQQVCLPSF